jgi:hypothetical protein
MFNFSQESILEIFDCYQKRILCLEINQAYIVGLIKRDASVWILQRDKEAVDRLEMDRSFQEKIEYVDGKYDIKFDYTLMDYKEYLKDTRPYSETRIIILKDKVAILKWFFNKKKYDVYSVVPSYKNTKMILSESCHTSVQRYWSIKDKSIFKSILLILQWVIIKNKLLRQLFSDKLIII